MRGRHDNHRRFEVPAANGSRPIVGGRLRGDKVSELFRSGRLGEFQEISVILSRESHIGGPRLQEILSTVRIDSCPRDVEY
jgi:hypothetical protein